MTPKTIAAIKAIRAQLARPLNGRLVTQHCSVCGAVYVRPAKHITYGEKHERKPCCSRECANRLAGVLSGEARAADPTKRHAKGGGRKGEG
jgi:hypothetical protein